MVGNWLTENETSGFESSEAITIKTRTDSRMDSRNITALLIALVITVSLLFGLVYFVQEGWPRLPPALALIVWILLAVAVIGYPIYALGQWSNRYVARLKKTRDNHNDIRHKRRKKW